MLNRVLIPVALIGVFITVVSLALDVKWRLSALESHNIDLERELQSLKDQVEVLSEEINQLKNHLDFLENLKDRFFSFRLWEISNGASQAAPTPDSTFWFVAVAVGAALLSALLVYAFIKANVASVQVDTSSLDFQALPENLVDYVVLPLHPSIFVPGQPHPDQWMLDAVKGGIQRAIEGLPLDQIDFKFLQVLEHLGKTGYASGATQNTIMKSMAHLSCLKLEADTRMSQIMDILLASDDFSRNIYIIERVLNTQI